MLTGHERNAHILLHSTQSLVEQNKFHRIASAQNQVSDRSLATVQQWHIVDRSTPLELTFEGLDAHLTSGHSCSETSRLQRLALWHLKTGHHLNSVAVTRVIIYCISCSRRVSLK